ncbi:TonB-dependent receptor [Granulosicoccus antarcticus]|uniref:Transferrin-binding protein 1 n=1 Tax=Granulosicoccus antarcticus IMCC3135 TaxID=1192854 RepID=A0A2Z2NYC6_9GAMM|nr:TonB-dependent receptor [Granulosicoccus antarcticus]ASJ74931.1 Transferrin-binding protein 1 [Granulosicoccus antarcticus IMCC3135]
MRSSKSIKESIATSASSRPPVLAGLLLLAFPWASTGLVYAEADTTLGTVEAIGELPYRTGNVISEESTASRSRVERVELERSPNALAAVLARESGVQYRQSGGFGSFSSVSIRAATGAQTAVYLDGVLLNNGGNPVVDFSTLEMLNLGSVDIYRGSTPMQLGHAGIGGAINLNSLQASKVNATRIRLGVGSLSLAGLQLSHQSRHGAWDVAAAISHRQSDNDFRFTNKNGTPLNTEDDTDEKRNNADARRTSALLRMGYQQNKNARTDLTIQVSARELGVPEWGNNPDNVASYDTAASQFQLSQILDGLGNWNSRHNIYWHTNSAQYQDLESQVGLGAQDSDNQTNTLGAKTYWEHLGDAGTLGLSLDLRQEKLDSTDGLDESAAFDARRQSSLATVHYVWFDSTDTWSLTPALRWQHNSLDGSQASTSQELHEYSSDSNTGLQIGLAYRPTSLITVTGNAGSFYREPSFGELYGSIGLVNGNPELKPENGINLDVGIQFRTDDMSLSSTLFGSERDELIVTSFNARGIGEPTNAGAARVIGIELAGELALTPKIQLRSNMTWQSPKSRDTAEGFRDKYLPGESQFSLYGRIQYQPSAVTLWYELDIQKKRFYDRANILPAADSEQHSIGIDWSQDQWQTTLGIHNISDDNIEDFNGYPKPGRTWSLSITRNL